MFKRVLLGLVFLVSLAWIASVGYGIFSSTNDFSEEYIFSEADGELLIVNRPKEINFSLIKEFSGSPQFDLVSNLSVQNYTKGFFSFKRPHFIVEKEGEWDEKSLKALFGRDDLRVNNEDKTLALDGWSGRFKHNRLYVFQGEIDPNPNPYSPFVHDKKATASVLLFGKNNAILSVSDVYFKSTGNVDYITRNEHIKQGNQVHDEDLFGRFISRKITSYHFYERDYYATLDPVYAKGPMMQWLKAGFVETIYQGETVLVADYIDGQDPILILNDLQQTTEANRFKTKLTSTFPKAGTSYFVSYLEDLVVIAEREEVCAQFVADHKLGNTITLDAKAQKSTYQDLPQAVSERYVSKETRISKAVYNGYLLETRFGKFEAQTVTRDESMAMTCNFEIADFHVFEGKGNVVALGKKGEVVYFKNGKETWRKKMESSPKGNLQIIELHGGGEQHILVNSEDEIYLWKFNGESPSGFPVKLDEAASNEVKFYRWKEKSYFLVATGQNRAYQFDSEGRELTVFKTLIPVVEKIEVWSSQSKLFFGFRSSTRFEMFDVAKKSSLRTYDVPAGSKTVKIPNEIVHFGINGSSFVRFDQKGTRTDFQKYEQSKLLTIQEDTKNPTIIIQAASELHFLNQQGIEFGKIRIPFTEMEDAHFSNNSGKSIVSVIDGLENNVYLYDMAGTMLIDHAYEGKTKVRITSIGSSLLITTVVDNYIIQYFEN